MQLLESPSECEWVDYKESLFLDTAKGQASFAKDALAIRNSGGGYIVVGVKDKTWERIGLRTPFPYDAKELIDKIRKVTGLDLEIRIAQHELHFGSEWNIFALIHIRGPSNPGKLKNPSRPIKGFYENEKWGVIRNVAYFRKDDSTTSVHDRNVLCFAEAVIEKLSIEIPSIEVAPFAIDDGFYKLLDKGYESFIGRGILRDKLQKAVDQDPRIWIINIHGPGGVGKSALVNWFTHSCYADRTYDAILQLTAKSAKLTPEGIRRVTPSLYSLDGLLDNILVLFGEKAERLDRKKDAAYEALSAFRFLLVLDNMESVDDARVLDFVQHIPAGSRSKVLITSRRRTGAWEFPLCVRELAHEELREFVGIKSREMGFTLDSSPEVITGIKVATGGLPLAVVWLLGRHRIEPDLQKIVRHLRSPDSPVLEFSFRNIWNTLDEDPRKLLGALTVFDETPTLELLAIATGWPIERVDTAIGDLEDVTLVDRVIQKPSGRLVYAALQLTLDFASRESGRDGDFVAECSRRYQEFLTNIEEPSREDLGYVFKRFNIDSKTEKRAARLCKRAESEAFSGNEDIAETLYQQARHLAPSSAYVLCQIGTFELQRTNLRVAEDLIDGACKQARNKKLKAYCYSVRARVMEAKGVKHEVLRSLETALDNDPDDLIVRHRYGVSLSRTDAADAAIDQFTWIVEREMKRKYPHETLMMALVTRAINWHRLGKDSKAREDVELGKKLMEKHSYLQGSTRHIFNIESQLED
jgi:tetratricopeptide (TPR) repeat protein